MQQPRAFSKEIAAAAEKLLATLPASAERTYISQEQQRHYAPLGRELHPADAAQFSWKAETGTVQSYKHANSRRHIHIDGPTGQFYDQQKNPVTQVAALDHAMGVGKHYAEPNQALEQAPLIAAKRLPYSV